MKKYLFIFAILICACNNKTTFKPQATDTLKTSVLYVYYDHNVPQIRGDVAFRIDKDSTLLDSVTPETFHKKQFRDSLYFVPVIVTLIDSAGKELKDSSGKPKRILQYQFIDKKLILQDYHKSF